MNAWGSIEEALTIGHGVERLFLCHAHEDTRASARVNSLTGLWLCFACGAKGWVDADKVHVSPDAVVRELKKLEDSLTHEQVIYSESWLNQFDALGPGEYWLGRFSPETCSLYRLGYDPATDAAVYPLRDNQGQVLGVVRRSLLDDGPKYLYPRGVDVSTMLFDRHRCQGDVVYLVEGATDAMALREIGVEAMAVYGSRLSRAQRTLLAAYSPTKIVAMFDQDSSGEAAARSVRAAFGEIVVRPTWDGYKDVSAMPVEVRRHVAVKALDNSRRVRLASRSCESHGTSPDHRRSISVSPNCERLTSERPKPSTR